jgi:hypothetical protein
MTIMWFTLYLAGYEGYTVRHIAQNIILQYIIQCVQRDGMLRYIFTGLVYSSIVFTWVPRFSSSYRVLKVILMKSATVLLLVARRNLAYYISAM